jgi:hypothetical protein
MIIRHLIGLKNTGLDSDLYKLDSIKLPYNTTSWHKKGAIVLAPFNELISKLNVELGIFCVTFNELPSGSYFITHQHTENTICFCRTFDGNLFECS